MKDNTEFQIFIGDQRTRLIHVHRETLRKPDNIKIISSYYVYAQKSR